MSSPVDDLLPKLLLVALGLLFELVVPQSLSYTAREVLLALLGVAAVALWRWLRELGIERITFVAVREAVENRLAAET
jgi:hypothetical protein